MSRDMPGVDPLDGDYGVFVIGPKGARFERLCAQIELALTREEAVGPDIAHWDTADVGSIPDEIRQKIERADVLLADIRDQRPNVIYEVGLAHGMGRPVVLFTAPGEDAPFDLAPYRFFAVADNGQVIDREYALRDQIQKAVRSGLGAASAAERRASTSVERETVGMWERLALQGHLAHLDVDAVQIGTRVFHLDEGLGRLVAFRSNDPDTGVTVRFQSGLRIGFELPDRNLYLASIERADAYE